MLLNMASAMGRLVLAGRELTRLAGFSQRVSLLLDVLQELEQGSYSRTMVQSAEAYRQPGAGSIVECNRLIQFEKVPLVTPNGELLLDDLTLTIPSGCNVIVAGPNGCGKSSLFR